MQGAWEAQSRCLGTLHSLKHKTLTHIIKCVLGTQDTARGLYDLVAS